MVTRIWAPNPIPALDGASGIIDLDDDAQAADLIAQGLADDVRQGAFAMSFPGGDPKTRAARAADAGDGGAEGDEGAGARYGTREARPVLRRTRKGE